MDNDLDFLEVACFGAAALYVLELENSIKPKYGRSVWCRPWILRRNRDGFCSKLLKELEIESPDLYKNFLRMTADDFDHLVSELITSF